MCGITGAVWNSPATSLDEATLRRMIEVLRHRGPDDEGLYTGDLHLRPGLAGVPGVALGHRRLSIIDLAGGHQPMGNEDGTVQVVFNGEIYNHRDLRRRLEATGHRFRTQSDTEVIVHLYEDEGPDCLKRFNGMFAIALWDAGRRQLLLARDRLGQKPLVYRVEPERLLFASELKSLLEVPGVPRQLDPQAIDLYLTYQYVPHPWAIFQGIAKLPPGCYAIYREGRLELQRYWQPDFCQEDRTRHAPRDASPYTERDARPHAEREEYKGPGGHAGELRQLLTSAVGMRLQSEVPLGAFLSGGLDSTIIVGLMSQLGTGPVRTFSIGFPVPEYDETRYAAAVARRFGTVHEEFRVEPDAVEVLPKLVWHFDEPFADSSAIPTWYVSQLTRRHVTVALTGDGGDELFAGYPRYRAVWLAAWLDRAPAVLRRVLASRLWQKLPASPRQKSFRRRLKRFLEVFGQTPARRYLEWISIFHEAQRAEALQRRLSGRAARRRPFGFPRGGTGPKPGPRSGHGRQPGRPGDLSALRSDAEGGHGFHGSRAGVPAAVSRPSSGGAGRAAADRAEVPPGPRKRAATGGLQRLAAPGHPAAEKDGVRGPFGPLVPRSAGRVRPRSAPRPTHTPAGDLPRGGGPPAVGCPPLGPFRSQLPSLGPAVLRALAAMLAAGKVGWDKAAVAAAGPPAVVSGQWVVVSG